MRKLKPQYEDFCRHYLSEANAHEAAIAAGYSRKSAYVTGSRLIGRPEIVARIQELRREVARRESLNRPALLMKLENAYAQAAANENPLAIVRVVELQAKLAGLVGAQRAGQAGDDEVDEEIAALDADLPPASERAHPRKPPRKAAPASIPASEAEPVLPVVGHDESPPVSETSPDEMLGASDDSETPDEEQRRHEVRRQETQRMALEAVARSRTRKRLRLSA